MLKGHVYPRLTSVRSPRTKRAAFGKTFERLRHTEFEGGKLPRRTLREMAWSAARKIAAEQRAIEHPPMPMPAKREESRILVVPSIALPRLHIGKV